MGHLKSRQLLVKLAEISQKKESKISRREIEKKINQIKYLSSQKKISKSVLKKEITNLEKRLHGVFLLEKKLKEKEKAENKELTSLKKQIKDLKQKMGHAKDYAVRKKVEKLSHLIGDVMAKESVKKEVKLEKEKKKVEKKQTELTLKKIDELQARILLIKRSGKVSLEVIAKLEERLTKLEEKLGVPKSVGSVVEVPKEVKHQMLFGPEEEMKLPSKPDKKELNEIEEEIDDLPIPPPPKIRKKK